MTNHNRKNTTLEHPGNPSIDGASVLSPVQFLNYAGDCRSAIGQVVGPMNGSDQVLTVISATYDPARHSTRLGLTYGVVELRMNGSA